MKYKVLIGGDLHKRMKDITTIRGYVKAANQVELDIINFIKENGITHFISLGDWFDKGYGSDVAAALVHTDIDRELSETLNGNFYGLIGNHIRLKMDSNPELFLIQPHPTLLSRHPVHRDEQIMKTPNSLILNGVQFSFLHYNIYAESAMDYKAMIDKTCKYHIGLYHTELIIPNDKLTAVNMQNVSTDNSQISRALEDIDLAIVGHIHKPIGTFTIHKSDGFKTSMIVPGSLMNTDAGINSRHEFIDMPLIEIDDDGTVTIGYHHQDLHVEMLTFLAKSVSDETREKLKSLQGNVKETLYEELEQTSFIGSSSFLTLNMFLTEQGYTKSDKDLIRTVIKNPEDISEMLKRYLEGQIC